MAAVAAARGRLIAFWQKVLEVKRSVFAPADIEPAFR
jgi:hypothetical protein